MVVRLEKHIEAEQHENEHLSKLLPHLMEDEKYVVHYRNLKYLISLGVKVTKLHRVIEFEQKAWLKPYINKNTEYRTRAKNEYNNHSGRDINNIRL